jgi:ferrous iron transport protein B
VSECHGCASCGGTAVADAPRTAGTQTSVALVGPPNSGKTTLFNRLTGLRQKVANFPGVTVEQHSGIAELPDGRTVRVIDLPGLYSLSPRSEDEQIAYDVLTGHSRGVARPHAVLLVLDSTNLSRQLMLAAPVLALHLPTLVILNLADDLRQRGGKVDAESLSKQLGAPVALVSARSGEGMSRVLDFLAGAMPKPSLMQLPVLQDVPGCRKWAGAVGAKAGYRAPAPAKWTRRLDKVFLHPVFGPLVFLFVVVAVFQIIFSVAAPLPDLVESLFDASGNWIASLLPDSLFRSLLIDGVWKGMGSVLVFLPQILLLFLFIGVLEDSGYLPERR